MTKKHEVERLRAAVGAPGRSEKSDKSGRQNAPPSKASQPTSPVQLPAAGIALAPVRKPGGRRRRPGLCHSADWPDGRYCGCGIGVVTLRASGRESHSRPGGSGESRKGGQGGSGGTGEEQVEEGPKRGKREEVVGQGLGLECGWGVGVVHLWATSRGEGHGGPGGIGGMQKGVWRGMGTGGHGFLWARGDQRCEKQGVGTEAEGRRRGCGGGQC